MLPSIDRDRLIQSNDAYNCRMTVYPKIAWIRVFAEGTTIVVSILLAFAIDAWWDERIEQRHAASLIAGLDSDFRISQQHLEQWLAGNRRILAAHTAFRDKLHVSEIGTEIDVPIDWVVAAIGAPTYSPTDATLQEAISSGRIDLIESRALRELLARWRQQFDDTREDELTIRDVVVNQLVPVLSESVRLGRAFDNDLLVDWFLNRLDAPLDERVGVRVTPQLEGAIAERAFYTQFVVTGLADLRDTQARIIELIAAEQTSGDML